jgi:hypothetical protein
LRALDELVIEMGFEPLMAALASAHVPENLLSIDPGIPV